MTERDERDDAELQPDGRDPISRRAERQTTTSAK